jgi:hypothetical protein
MVPMQLRMGMLRVKPVESMSIVFRRCALAEQTFLDLIDEIVQFEGEYQRLTLDGVYLNRAVSQALFGMLKSAKCFRSLEVLELNGFDFRRLGVEAFAGLFGDILKQHRFLHRIAFGDVRRPMPIPLSLLSTTALLVEVVLTGLDMSEQFECIVRPANVRLLNLSRCHFTWTSLRSLFDSLARSKSPLSLVLQDLCMPAHHLLAFLENLRSTPQMSYVQELD